MEYILTSELKTDLDNQTAVDVCYWLDNDHYVTNQPHLEHIASLNVWVLDVTSIMRQLEANATAREDVSVENALGKPIFLKDLADVELYNVGSNNALFSNEENKFINVAPKLYYHAKSTIISTVNTTTT